MSKAFYKPSAIPKLLHRYQNKSNNNRRVVEIWTTTCVVTNFGKTTRAECIILINPSNPNLTGTKNFPYFPRGGPVPREQPMSMHKDWQPLGHVSTWGGMEVGSGMMYPVSVVDGLVHQLGGWQLQAECAMKRTLAREGEPCPVGLATETLAPGQLSRHFDSIIHTTPPFYKHHAEPEKLLQSCYRQAFDLAFRKTSSQVRVASPLLGAGARGFPQIEATNIAAVASKEWLESTDSLTEREEDVLVFGLLESKLADAMATALETELEAQQ